MAYFKKNIPELIEEIRRGSPSFTGSNLRKVHDNDIVRICDGSLRNWEIT